MSKSKMGALVRYCGHHAVFVADIFEVAGANVVRANGQIEEQLDRRVSSYQRATHQLVDFPVGGFWRPGLGIFVVPADQVTEIKPRKAGNKS